MDINFLGATGTVTGSKYLIEASNHKILVDCGLFQGYKELRLRNWTHLPFKPASLSAVVITHAHIDHTGYLPLLVKNGYKGPIYATKSTIDLCSILLPDSGHLQEEDARRANFYHYSKHDPALPLYTQDDAERVMKQFVEVDYKTPYTLFDDVIISWHRAGHILGSSFVQIEHEHKKILFSGDIGRHEDPIMKPAEAMEYADYLILESTYGNRLHEKNDPAELIAKVINETIQKKGTVLIPSFAVGRAQLMLYYLYILKRDKLIPDIPVYLDSPMAIDATEILLHSTNEHKLSPALCKEICRVATYVNSPEESKTLDKDNTPKIIISASGMMTGGRILHHLKIFAPFPNNTILLTGFQAAGTRGEKLLSHEKTLKIHGEMVPIEATVEVLTNTSAHADYEEILMWLKQFQRPPKKVFITHGEPEASLGLKKHIEEVLGWNCCIPNYLDKYELI